MHLDKRFKVYVYNQIQCKVYAFRLLFDVIHVFFYLNENPVNN